MTLRSSARPARAIGSSRPVPNIDRLAELERAVAGIQKTLDVQFARIAAMQAEIDHSLAKGRTRQEFAHAQPSTTKI